MITPTRTYNELKHEIKSGDILLCSGTATFSKLIQRATNSQWSHVGLIMRVDDLDRIVVMESVESIGVRSVPLSYYVDDYNATGKPYPGKMLIARHDQVDESHFTDLFKTAIDLLGYPYDRDEILKIAYRLLTHAMGQDAPVEQGRGYICSEYAYACLKSIGVSIAHSGDFVTPGDFYADPRINPVAYLSHS